MRQCIIIIKGGSMYEIGDACSNCPAGSVCEAGLCAWTNRYCY